MSERARTPAPVSAPVCGEKSYQRGRRLEFASRYSCPVLSYLCVVALPISHLDDFNALLHETGNASICLLELQNIH